LQSALNVFEEIIRRDDIGDYLPVAAKSENSKDGKINSSINEFELELNKELLKSLSAYPAVREKLTEDMTSELSAVLGNGIFRVPIEPPATIYTPQGSLVLDAYYCSEDYDS
jgi:hypothetical protein